jgi:pimeloyl-ACP methyl ester carboxylesterase
VQGEARLRPGFVILGPMRTVLVHGLAGSSRWWREVEPRLSGLDLDAVDLPRRGLEELERWLAARLEPPSALVGHSLGGLLAARVAAREPDLVQRLVLIAPAGIPVRGRLAHALPLAHAVAQMGLRFAPVLVRDAARAGPLGLWAGARAAVTTDLRDDLAHVRARTLLVWGDRDRLVPASSAAAWAAALPEARVELIPRTGHVPMVERPEELSRLLRDFLSAP